MPFVKLDCGLLDSTLWSDSDACRLFLAGLLMAVPRRFSDAVEAIATRTLTPLGYTVPPNEDDDYYGFVAAAGPGIVRRAGLDLELGTEALERLAAPDATSRTPDHEGRRMVRVPGGYLVLNFSRYRDRDYTSTERSRRFRAERRAAMGMQRPATALHRDATPLATHADADADADAEKKPDHVGTTRPVEAPGPLVLVGDNVGNKQASLIPADPLRPAVERIFAHWCDVLRHPASKLSRDRAGRIRARLAEGGTEEECLRAIDGCAASPWHRGDNEHGRVYDAIDLIFRNRAKLEMFHERLAASKARAAAALANPPPPPDPRVDPTVPCCQCGQPVGGAWARTDRGPAHSGACRDAVVRAGVEQVGEPVGAGG